MQIIKARELIEEAVKARNFAYVPYSKFSVGAALLTKTGKVYTGCNVESVSYTPTCCAERVAFLKAVSEGERNFTAIAVVGGKNDEKIRDLCPPCGVCRQVMMEFCNSDEFEIILAQNPENIKMFKLKDLLPLGFGPSNLT